MWKQPESGKGQQHYWCMQTSLGSCGQTGDIYTFGQLEVRNIYDHDHFSSVRYMLLVVGRTLQEKEDMGGSGLQSSPVQRRTVGFPGTAKKKNNFDQGNGLPSGLRTPST